MAILEKPYCSLLDVVQTAGNSEPELHAVFVDSINRASRRIDEICGRDFWSHDHLTDSYVVSRRRVVGKTVLLPFEIKTLTEVRLDGNALDLTGMSFEAGDTYFESASELGGIPFTGELALKGTFGFSTTTAQVPPTDLPASVRRAAILIACAFSNEWRRERVAFDGSRESLLETKVPSEVNDLLKPWLQRGRGVNF
jgi:hypothetical protein